MKYENGLWCQIPHISHTLQPPLRVHRYNCILTPSWLWALWPSCYQSHSQLIWTTAHSSRVLLSTQTSSWLQELNVLIWKRNLWADMGRVCREEGGRGHWGREHTDAVGPSDSLGAAVLQSSLPGSEGLFYQLQSKSCLSYKYKNMWRGGSEGIKGLE